MRTIIRAIISCIVLATVHAFHLGTTKTTTSSTTFTKRGVPVRRNAAHFPTASASQSSSAGAGAGAGAAASRLFCICINCKYVTNCAAYHFVEEKHEQPHISAVPDFEPRNGSPTINVHMRPIVGKQEVEERMKLEHKSEEEKAMAKAAAAAAASRNDDDDDSAASQILVGDTVYDMRPEMSLEYDVVACEDFVEDMGCWIRHMPEEIRLANPNFVPP